MPLPANAYPPVEEVQTPEGISAWLMPVPAQPVMTMRIAFKGAGWAYDGQDTQGMAALVSALLLEGTQEMDATAFNTVLDAHAIELSFSADADYFLIELQTLTQYQDIAFDMLAKALTQAALAEDSVTKVKQRYASQRARRKQYPDYHAQKALRDVVFAGHPYQQDMLGSEASMDAITPAAMRQFILDRLTRDHMVIAVAGDVTAESLSGLLHKHLSVLPAKGAAYTAIPLVTPKGTDILRIPFEASQSSIQFSLPGVQRRDPEFYTAYVLNHILGGGGFASLMMQRLREEHGYVYGASSSLSGLDHAKAISGEMNTRVMHTDAALEALTSLLHEVQGGSITPAQVDDAISDIAGALPLNLDTTGKMTAYLLSMQLHELGRDYLQKRNSYFTAVTHEDVNRLAAQLLRPEQLAIAVAGPEAGAEKGE